VVKDQRATRRFYEDLIGMPLVACSTEAAVLSGQGRVFCHTVYGLGDGSGLAFFQFEQESDYEEFGLLFRGTPFVHIALKVDAETHQAIKQRLEKANWDHHVLEHAHCESLYTTDPDGLILEFTFDHPDAAEIRAERRRTAAADLDRWLGGDHSPTDTNR
jgi:catechol 2,3-dioxygenase-like lactoylglutathione lyase family enzyme